MALQLEYRATFIDVVEGPKFLTRYHSLPAFGTVTEDDATIDYVQKLSERAENLCGPSVKQVASLGSLGHSLGLCKRPCALFAGGHCKHGADCSFCHMSHEQRLPKLDKQQRTKLKMLSVAQLLSIILEPLKMKVWQQGIQNEAAEIIEIMELEVAKYPQVQELDTGAIAKKTHGATRILAKMSIAGLIGVAGCNQADSSAFRMQLMDALERLRYHVKAM